MVSGSKRCSQLGVASASTSVCLMRNDGSFAWINEHARIAWAVDPTPWVVEKALLASATLALNVDGRSDAFSKELKDRRTEARRQPALGPNRRKR